MVKKGGQVEHALNSWSYQQLRKMEDEFQTENEQHIPMTSGCGREMRVLRVFKLTTVSCSSFRLPAVIEREHITPQLKYMITPRTMALIFNTKNIFCLLLETQ